MSLIVLSANLAATWVFAGIAAIPDVFPPATMQAMAEISAHTWRDRLAHGSNGRFGWLADRLDGLAAAIAHTGRTPIIILLTYVIAICQFPHIIAGSVEAAFGVFTGGATVGDYVFASWCSVPWQCRRGHDLAALSNHAPLAGE